MCCCAEATPGLVRAVLKVTPELPVAQEEKNKKYVKRKIFGGDEGNKLGSKKQKKQQVQQHQKIKFSFSKGKTAVDAPKHISSLSDNATVSFCLGLMVAAQDVTLNASADACRDVDMDAFEAGQVELARILNARKV